MNDATSSIVASVRQHLKDLATLVREGEQDRAHQLINAIETELERARPERVATGARSADKPPPEPGSDPVKCPRCTLRAFACRPGTLREKSEHPGHFEAHYHCMSCGHEDWLPVR